mgnify:CR=1 FL=1
MLVLDRWLPLAIVILVVVVVFFPIVMLWHLVRHRATIRRGDDPHFAEKWGLLCALRSLCVGNMPHCCLRFWQL